MEALFIVPTMVSPNVNFKLVPALTKMVERNILLTNYAVLRSAMLKRYRGIFKRAHSESNEYDEVDTTELLEDPNTKERELGLKKADIQTRVAGGIYKGATGMVTGPRETPTDKPILAEPEKIELPKGIQFFHTISLEPTIMEIPVSMKTTMFGGVSERVLRVGIKCVPYTVKGVEDILRMMKVVKSRKMIRSSFYSKLNFLKRKITQPKLTGKVDDILLAPSSEFLSKSSNIEKIMKSGGTSTWSTLVILSTFDFPEKDLKSSLYDYRELVAKGWGDMVFVNESKESVHFCTTKLNACYELSLGYIKQLFNLSNILDYSEVSRWSKPLRVTPLARALSDGVESPSDEAEGRILEVING